jgi:hypothetical protein
MRVRQGTRGHLHMHLGTSRSRSTGPCSEPHQFHLPPPFSHISAGIETYQPTRLSFMCAWSITWSQAWEHGNISLAATRQIADIRAVTYARKNEHLHFLESAVPCTLRKTWSGNTDMWCPRDVMTVVPKGCDDSCHANADHIATNQHKRVHTLLFVVCAQ